LQSTDKLFANGDTVAVAIPREVAERYHLAPGVEVEITPSDDGIRLVPVGVPHWFSFEWEAALNEVLERYGTVFQMLKEIADMPPPEESESGPAAGEPQP
jgi:hypothetical protein